MAQILVRCTERERERLKAKAKVAGLTLNNYLLKQGLEIDRRQLEEGTIAKLYSELVILNYNLLECNSSDVVQQAIDLSMELRRALLERHEN